MVDTRSIGHQVMVRNYPYWALEHGIVTDEQDGFYMHYMYSSASQSLGLLNFMAQSSLSMELLFLSQPLSHVYIYVFSQRRRDMSMHYLP